MDRILLFLGLVLCASSFFTLMIIKDKLNQIKKLIDDKLDIRKD